MNNIYESNKRYIEMTISHDIYMLNDTGTSYGFNFNWHCRYVRNELEFVTRLVACIDFIINSLMASDAYLRQ